MVFGSMLLVWSLGIMGQSFTAPTPKESPCVQALAGGADAATAEVCLGEEQARLADAAPKGSAQRPHQWEAAVEHYRRAANVTSTVLTKARALDALAQLYDAQHLNEPHQMEGVLRERIALRPNELAPVYRLAKLQEDQGLLDAAEDTLLVARHQEPDTVEPYKMLAQFYARRATALHDLSEKRKPPEPTSGPGEPDAHGIYRVGPGVESPNRLDVARYPKEAAAAAIQGAVVAEVVINEAGIVTDARVIRSIPVLDEEALRAVRQWRFEPKIVNGQAVPVRMTVTINFVQSRQ